MQQSVKNGLESFRKPEGIDKLYKSIKYEKKKNFVRNLDKIEANINPEPNGTVLVGPRIVDEVQ